VVSNTIISFYFHLQLFLQKSFLVSPLKCRIQCTPQNRTPSVETDTYIHIGHFFPSCTIPIPGPFILSPESLNPLCHVCGAFLDAPFKCPAPPFASPVDANPPPVSTRPILRRNRAFENHFYFILCCFLPPCLYTPRMFDPNPNPWETAFLHHFRGGQTKRRLRGFFFPQRSTLNDPHLGFWSFLFKFPTGRCFRVERNPTLSPPCVVFCPPVSRIPPHGHRGTRRRMNNHMNFASSIYIL